METFIFSLSLLSHKNILQLTKKRYWEKPSIIVPVMLVFKKNKTLQFYRSFLKICWTLKQLKPLQKINNKNRKANPKESNASNNDSRW